MTMKKLLLLLLLVAAPLVWAALADVTFGDIVRWGLVRRLEAVLSASVRTVWTGTQAQYDALTPDPDTLYFIQ